MQFSVYVRVFLFANISSENELFVNKVGYQIFVKVIGFSCVFENVAKVIGFIHVFANGEECNCLFMSVFFVSANISRGNDFFE